MELHKQILPCTINPFDDELLSSWLVRLSHRHYCKIHPFCKILFPKINIWNRDIDKIAPIAIQNILKQRTFATADQIKQTTLANYDGKIYLNHNPFGNTRWIMPLGIYHREHKNYGLMYCPSCLKKDLKNPFYRKKWRLSFSLVCCECGYYLIDKCENCQKPIVFFRTELGQRMQLPEHALSICYHCKVDLTSFKQELASKNHLKMQKELYRITSQGWNKTVIYPHLYFDALYQILRVLKSPSKRCQKLQFNLGLESVIDNIKKEIPNAQKMNFDLLPSKTRLVLLEKAYALLKDLGKKLKKIGVASKLTSFVLFSDFKNIPFWYESLVMENFYVSNVNRRFEPLK